MMKQLLILAVIISGLILGGPLSAQDWRDIPLRDAVTGETFRITDFRGTPILLESFAVWCPCPHMTTTSRIWTPVTSGHYLKNPMSGLILQAPGVISGGFPLPLKHISGRWIT